MAKRNARRFKKVKKFKTSSNVVSRPPRSVNVDLNVVDAPDTDVGVSDDEPMEAVHDIEDGVETSIAIEDVMEADIEDNKDGVGEMKDEVIIAFEEDNVNGNVGITEKEAEIDVKEKTDVNDEDDGADVKNIIEKKESPKKVKARKKIQSCFATKFWKGRNYSAFALKRRKSHDLNLIKREDKEMDLPSTSSTSDPSLEDVENSNIKLPISVEATGVSEDFHQEIPLEHEESCVKPDDPISNPYKFRDAYFPIPNIRIYVTKYDEDNVGTDTVNSKEGYANPAGVGVGNEESKIISDSKSTDDPRFTTDIVHDGPFSCEEIENGESVFKDVATDLDSSIYNPCTPLLRVSKYNQYYYKKPGMQFEQFSDSESEYSQPSASPSFCDRFFAPVDTPMDSGEGGGQMPGTSGREMEVQDVSNSKDKMIGTEVLECGMETKSASEQGGDGSMSSSPVSIIFDSPPLAMHELVNCSGGDWVEENDYEDCCDVEGSVDIMSLLLQKPEDHGIKIECGGRSPLPNPSFAIFEELGTHYPFLDICNEIINVRELRTSQDKLGALSTERQVTSYRGDTFCSSLGSVLPYPDGVVHLDWFGVLGPWDIRLDIPDFLECQEFKVLEDHTFTSNLAHYKAVLVPKDFNHGRREIISGTVPIVDDQLLQDSMDGSADSNNNLPTCKDVVLYRAPIQSWATLVSPPDLKDIFVHNIPLQSLDITIHEIPICKDLVVYTPSKIPGRSSTARPSFANAAFEQHDHMVTRPTQYLEVIVSNFSFCKDIVVYQSAPSFIVVPLRFTVDFAFEQDNILCENSVCTDIGLYQPLMQPLELSITGDVLACRDIVMYTGSVASTGGPIIVRPCCSITNVAFEPGQHLQIEGIPQFGSSHISGSRQAPRLITHPSNVEELNSATCEHPISPFLHEILKMLEPQYHPDNNYTETIVIKEVWSPRIVHQGQTVEVLMGLEAERKVLNGVGDVLTNPLGQFSSLASGRVAVEWYSLTGPRKIDMALPEAWECIHLTRREDHTQTSNIVHYEAILAPRIKQMGILDLVADCWFVLIVVLVLLDAMFG